VSFEEVKSRVTLEQVLLAYQVEGLRRSGRHQYRGRCPIHQGEGREACHANLARNVFHCFACGAGGNVLDFVAAMERSSIREAALRLQENGLCLALQRPPARPPFRSAEAKLVTKKREVNAPLSFSLSLDGNHPYLVQRGIERVTVDYFGVGFFGGGGLMNRRVAIPVHDGEGRLVAYCGRAIDGSAPRYRFPAGFQKSRVLFNYHRALATGSDEVILVEGFFDCMRVHQAGFSCVVALMGVPLSEAQKELRIPDDVNKRSGAM
jgi:DNA primase